MIAMHLIGLDWSQIGYYYASGLCVVLASVVSLALADELAGRVWQLDWWR